MTASLLRLDLDGRRPSLDELAQLALVNDGHFTAAHVRSGRVRGLELHLQRLQAASQELWGASIDRAQTLALVRRALAGINDAFLRLTIFPSTAGGLSTLVSLRATPPAPALPQSLALADYERPLAHIKHVGTFAQVEYARRAEREGYDDALLTRDGWIRETTAANIGFLIDGEIVWPQGPVLPGITMQLLQAGLRSSAIPMSCRPVHVSESTAIGAAFLTRSTGIVPVGRMGQFEVPVDLELMAMLAGLYEGVPEDDL